MHDVTDYVPPQPEQTPEERTRYAYARERAAFWDAQRTQANATREAMLARLGGDHETELQDAYAVSYYLDADMRRPQVVKVYVDIGDTTSYSDDSIRCTPQGALNLLAWLKEQEPMLRQLVEKEDAHEPTR